MDEYTIFHYLLGKNGYSVTPEEETELCWCFLLIGLLTGVFGTVLISSLFEK